jgi:iron complex transport system substrate-binding protein
MAEVEKSTRELGRLTHHEQKADEIVKQLESKVQPRATPTSPRVLTVIGGTPGPFSEVWFVRRNSLHGSVLEAAGARNAVGENVTGAPVLSLEKVVALDPDAIVVLVAMEGIDAATQQKYIDAWKVLPTLKAVKNNRVYVLAGTDMQSTGPRILQAQNRLAALVRTIGASL